MPFLDCQLLPANGYHQASQMRAFLSIVFFANMWQLLLSLLATLLNAFFACFSVEAEWQSYAAQYKPLKTSGDSWMRKFFGRYNKVDQDDVPQGKALRVTSPQGKQRSTYFLALPVRYAAPLMLTFLILHWTLSQSMFLTVLATYDDGVFANEFMFFGSSPRPLMLGMFKPPFFTSNNKPLTSIAVCIGVLLLVAVIIVMCKVSTGMLPRGGSCSAVLSAACHGHRVDGTKPVLWGEVESMRAVDGVGRCCFVNRGAVVPEEGRLYA
jgi:hypothetical protein